MCKKSSVRASRIPRFLWLAAFAFAWTMAGTGGMAFGQVAGVDDPADMADTSGDIKRIEAWVEDGNLNLTMTVHGVFAPSVGDTPAGMTNRYYYHWLLDTDNNPSTGYHNSEYEGNATNLQNPIGVDIVVQFGWRDGNTNGVYAYDPLTEDEFFQDYEYTIEGDTIHAIIPLVDLGLTPNDIIAVSAFQEGASDGWSVDWIESAVLALTVTKATNPVPATESVDIPRDVTLSWKPGASAATHNLYFGTDGVDINDATVPTEQDLDVNSFDPGRLDFGQTYYWRVDEVNGAPDFAVFKGDLWSFTVEPFAYPIEDIIASSNGISEEGAGIEKTIDGSGLNAAGEHSTEATDMWLAVPGDDPLYVQYEFDGIYKLHQMLVWNYNVQFELVLGFGVKDVTVEYSTDGAEWTILGDVACAQGTASSDYTANTTIDFGGVPVKYVRLLVSSGQGLIGQFGLSEVQFLYIPVQARQPEPADGQIGVSVATTLAWRAGREAASHDVSMGTDPDALTAAGTVDAPMFEPEVLDLETTYYWRVDEVNDAEPLGMWAGPVWSFTTESCIVVDDFESYDDEENRIYSSWVDGYQIDDNGSQVGNLESPFAEQTIVHGGEQSMPLFYDNTGAPASEAALTLSQDWTASGVGSLVLHFHGAEDNAGQLYVKINGTKVAYSGDAGDIAGSEWISWQIDLAAVGGNLSNVSSLVIGVEGAGATGVVYIDDVQLCPSSI